MNKRVWIALMVCGLVAGWTMQPAFGGRNKGKGGENPASMLSSVEAADLLFMREEEKLARDVYLAMYDEYGLRIFSNIPKAEQRHMDAILGLLDAYGLADPARNALGEFSDPELQELYDTLVLKGRKSKLDALMVGALIEEVDMEDIVEAMERTERADILKVYSNLLAGSKKHMNAFVRNIEGLTGETYVAQWISQEEVDEILGR